MFVLHISSGGHSVWELPILAVVGVGVLLLAVAAREALARWGRDEEDQRRR